MKRFKLSVPVTAYQEVWVDAETEDEAIAIVLGDENGDDLEWGAVEVSGVDVVRVEDVGIVPIGYQMVYRFPQKMKV
jgi:hypothetical protein